MTEDSRTPSPETKRNRQDDAEARRWARETRDALEAGDVSDETGALARRLTEEKAKKSATL
jgi:hypothetical protein